MNAHRLRDSLLAVILIVPACSTIVAEPTMVPVATAKPITTNTQIPEAGLIATEQARAMAVKTEGALTRAAQPTLTPPPTQTLVLAHLPTLPPIPNSTPAQKGAFFDIPPDVLGSRYEIENACYFDTQSGWERYEIYAGAVSDSGDVYSAQGVVVIRVFRVTEQNGHPAVELVETQEHLTSIKRGPLKLYTFGSCSPDLMTLTSPLNFIWFLHPPEEFYPYKGTPPLARLESGGTTQIADLGSYCWGGGCLDGPGVSTSSMPLPIESSSSIYLRLPLDEVPDHLSMNVMFISPVGSLEYDPPYDEIHGPTAGWSYEKPGRELLDLGKLPLQREQEIKLALEPGYYVLVIFAAWRDYGDVKYGFLLEVK